MEVKEKHLRSKNYILEKGPSHEFSAYGVAPDFPLSLISIVSGIFEMLTIIDPSSSYRHVFLPYNIYCRFTAMLRRPKMRSVLFRPFDIVIVYQIVIVYSQVYSIDSVTISSSRMHLQLYYGVRILPSLIYAADPYDSPFLYSALSLSRF